ADDRAGATEPRQVASDAYARAAIAAGAADRSGSVLGRDRGDPVRERQAGPTSGAREALRACQGTAAEPGEGGGSSRVATWPSRPRREARAQRLREQLPRSLARLLPYLLELVDGVGLDEAPEQPLAAL